jgi:hypothetical protein
MDAANKLKVKKSARQSESLAPSNHLYLTRSVALVRGRLPVELVVSHRVRETDVYTQTSRKTSKNYDSCLPVRWH